MEVMRLGLDRASDSYVVVLREKGGTRLLPIWIGQAEAESIALEINGIRRERPLTHDLCKAIIGHLGATVRRVHITRVQERTFFAELHLASRDGSVLVDARPSDSIAIALRCAAPIYAQSSLLTAILLEESEPQAADEPLSAEQLKSYLENLRPEDFGKFNL